MQRVQNRRKPNREWLRPHATVTLFHYTRNLTRIPVQTPSRAYEVLIERGLLRSAAAALRELIAPGTRVLCV